MDISSHGAQRRRQPSLDHVASCSARQVHEAVGICAHDAGGGRANGSRARSRHGLLAGRTAILTPNAQARRIDATPRRIFASPCVMTRQAVAQRVPARVRRPATTDRHRNHASDDIQDGRQLRFGMHRGQPPARRPLRSLIDSRIFFKMMTKALRNCGVRSFAAWERTEALRASRPDSVRDLCRGSGPGLQRRARRAESGRAGSLWRDGPAHGRPAQVAPRKSRLPIATPAWRRMS